MRRTQVLTVIYLQVILYKCVCFWYKSAYCCEAHQNGNDLANLDKCMWEICWDFIFGHQEDFPPSSLPFFPNNVTWLIGRRDHTNTIIMIYETISDGNRAFSSDLMATCKAL